MKFSKCREFLFKKRNMTGILGGRGLHMGRDSQLLFSLFLDVVRAGCSVLCAFAVTFRPIFTLAVSIGRNVTVSARGAL